MGQDCDRFSPGGIHRRTELEGDAKANVVVPVVRRVPVTVRRPAIDSGVVPTAATVNAVRALLIAYQEPSYHTFDQLTPAFDHATLLDQNGRERLPKLTP